MNEHAIINLPQKTMKTCLFSTFNVHDFQPRPNYSTRNSTLQALVLNFVNFGRLHKMEGSVLCFYDNFIKLCKTKGVAPSKALIEAGLSKSLNSKWASNPYSTPNGETLTRLAAYFGCSITELSTEIILSKEEQQELYNLFEAACNAQGYSCAHAIVQAKVKNNFLNRLKNQCLSRPYLPDVYSVAQYLNIVDGVNLFFDAITEAKKPTGTAADELDNELINLLSSLTPGQIANVTAYIQGMLSK